MFGAFGDVCGWGGWLAVDGYRLADQTGGGGSGDAGGGGNAMTLGVRCFAVGRLLVASAHFAGCVGRIASRRSCFRPLRGGVCCAFGGVRGCGGWPFSG